MTRFYHFLFGKFCFFMLGMSERNNVRYTAEDLAFNVHICTFVDLLFALMLVLSPFRQTMENPAVGIAAVILLSALACVLQQLYFKKHGIIPGIIEEYRAMPEQERRSGLSKWFFSRVVFFWAFPVAAVFLKAVV